MKFDYVKLAANPDINNVTVINLEIIKSSNVKLMFEIDIDMHCTLTINDLWVAEAPWR